VEKQKMLSKVFDETFEVYKSLLRIWYIYHNTFMSIGLIASANVMPLYLYHDPVMRCSSLASDLDFACGMSIHYFM
jgi:hypothetical protein